MILWPAAPLMGQSFNDYDLEPHRYFEAPLHDPVSVFLQGLEKKGKCSKSPMANPW